jgi:gamma-glutamyltranspeptidase/glutathione hydrolase
VQVLAHLLDGGLDAQAAVDAPRAQWFHGADCVIEEGFGPGVREALAAAGFEVRPGFADPEEMGVAQVVRRHPDGWLEGGSDRRHDGLAAGW